MTQDRRQAAYLNATALDQAMLEETFRGGETEICTVGELTKLVSRVVTLTAVQNPLVVTLPGHGFANLDTFMFTTDGTLPSPLDTVNTWYVRYIDVNNFNVSVLPAGPLIATIGGSPTGTHALSFTRTFRFSDRPKYVGDSFYQGRATFPDIKRTIGELVAPSIQFSEMSVELNNVDGFYNQYLTGGVNYFSFVGARLVIKVGLSDIAATYFPLFDGTVPDDDGFSIERELITIRARDKADALNRDTGLPTINTTDFPSAPQASLGKVIPMVIGDWEAGYNFTAGIGTVSVTSGGTQFAVITDSAVDFAGGIAGYPVGGGFFVFSIGSYTPETISKVHIKRGNDLIPVTFNASPVNTAGYWSAQVLSYTVVGGGTIPYVAQDGDIACIKVKIPYAVGQYGNPIQLAKEILKTLGDVTEAQFDAASWNTLLTKSTPAQSAMTAIMQRIWIGKPNDKILEYTLQLLEQVRVELYWNSTQLIALRSLHPEDFSSQGSTRFEQIYLDENSLKVEADTRNFFNKALANYSYTPCVDKTTLQTKIRKNQNSIDKSGREVLKAIDFPNLYVAGDVINQLDEFIRFYSAGQEYVSVTAAWTTLLRDLGEVILFVYQIASVNYNAAPMKIRDITFHPDDASLIYRLLSFANFPYSGNAPSNASQMLSSQTQSITDA